MTGAIDAAREVATQSNREFFPMPYQMVAIAIILAGCRILGETSEVFQAVAHLFVGGCFTAGYIEFDRERTEKFVAVLVEVRRYLSYPATQLAIVLSLIELACFLWFKFGAAV